jgi:hypothetical protein
LQLSYYIGFLLALILGNRNGYTKSDEGKMMSALSLGNTDTAYTQPKPDRAHPFVSLGCVAHTFTNFLISIAC